MRQAEIAESAHAQLVDRLVGPSPLGTGLANAEVNRVFSLYLHGGRSQACLVEFPWPSNLNQVL